MKEYIFKAGNKQVNGKISIERLGLGFLIQTFFNNETIPVQEIKSEQKDIITNLFKSEQDLIILMTNSIVETSDKTLEILYLELEKQGF